MFSYLASDDGRSALVGDTTVLLLGEPLTAEQVERIRMLMDTVSVPELSAVLRDPHGLGLTHFALCEMRGGVAGETVIAVGGNFASLSRHDADAAQATDVAVDAVATQPSELQRAGASAAEHDSADQDGTSPFEQLFEHTQYFGVEAAAVRSAEPTEEPAAAGEHAVVPHATHESPAVHEPSAAPRFGLALPDGAVCALDRPVVIGRNPEAPAGHTPDAVTLWRLSDRQSGVSRTHARIDPAPGGVEVTDLGSTNGTVVLTAAGETISLVPHEARRLSVGDRVHLSGALMLTVTEASSDE